MIRNTNSGDQENDNFNDLLNKFDSVKDKKGWEALISEAKQREPLIMSCFHNL